MVKVRSDRAAELAALVRAQSRDDAARRVRRGGGIRNGLDLDKRIARPITLLLLEGRAHEWGVDADEDGNCPTCHGDPGRAVCLRCNASGLDELINWRGRESRDIGGPTTYTGPPKGLAGGVGKATA